MALTWSNIASILEEAYDGILTEADLDLDLYSIAAINRALRQCGYTVTSPTTVTAADVAAVSVADEQKFLDHCALNVLYQVWADLTNVDITVGPRTEKLSQLADRVERMIARLEKYMASAYGLGMPEPQAGYISLDKADHNDELY